MPAVHPGSKVLVTGASGFIATWVVKVLLECGFHVRGTVRSVPKGEFLAKLFENHAGSFEYIVVEDIAKEGAFDDAVKGVDAVEHTASPFHMKADEPDEIIGPAVRGTLGILESVKKNGSAIKRVVITSSVAAIVEPSSTPQTLTEKNWNEFSPREVESKGRDASGLHKYRASKALAERGEQCLTAHMLALLVLFNESDIAAWDFVARHQDSIKWDIVTLNPPLVWGPTIHEIPSASSLNTSIADIYAIMKGTKPITADPIGNWIDVRDVAAAHVAGLTTAAAGGERFLIASGPVTWQDFADAVHADPEYAALPRGRPGTARIAVLHPVLLNTAKAQAVLGVAFRGLGESALDSMRSLVQREREEKW